MKLRSTTWCQFAILVSWLLISGNSAGSEAKIPVGIQQTQLIWKSPAYIQEIMGGIGRDLPGLAFFRTDIQENTPANLERFVEIARRSQECGMKLYLMVSPAADDFDYQAKFPFRLSEVNLTKFARRLAAYLDAVEKAKLEIAVVEIGNELDASNFNADVPNGDADKMSADQILAWKRSYARFLETSVETIRSAKYFAEAKIVTVGLVNPLGWNPGMFVPNAEKHLAELRELDGKNYLAEVDGYGMHIYPPANSLILHTKRVFSDYVEAGLNDKPIWISEWNIHKSQTPFEGKSRAELMRQWLDFVNSYKALKFSAAIYFDYHSGDPEWDLFDSAGVLRKDEAAVLLERSENQTSRK